MVGLIPMLLAGVVLVATPTQVLAASGLTHTAVTTYEVLPAQNVIHVTVVISLHNSKPPTSCGPYCTTQYFWNTTEIAIETKAGAVSSTSNAGKVRQKVTESGTYYRFVEFTYPNVYYGQTRVVTVTYNIPAAPDTASRFRAVQAYAYLCAIGHGFDGGSVAVVLPDNFKTDSSVSALFPKSSTSGGKTRLSTGNLTEAYKFYGCLDAADASKYSSTSLTVGAQQFQIQAWPEDADWTEKITGKITEVAPNLEDLTGLKMPSGTVSIRESGDTQIGGYAGAYNPLTKTVSLGETATRSTIAHELSHIWFNYTLFDAMWMDEGFAGYSQTAAGIGNFDACREPGAYPGAGSPDLTVWVYLDVESTTTDENVAQYQYEASCYIVTNLAEAMGADNFKSVLQAGVNGEIAYVGAGTAEKKPTAGTALTARELLDLVDERGMIPGGVADLDQAQKLMDRYGVFSDSSLLDSRAEARETYHELATSAGTWKLPYALRSPMASWDFPSAQTAMASLQEIVDLRDKIYDDVPNFSLDGGAVQTQFEGAQTQADLDALLALMKKEADAGAKVGEAATKSANPIEMIGLLGADLNSSLNRAKAALQNAKPDEAAAAAQSAVDTVNGSLMAGLLRLVGLMAAAAGAAFLIRRQRRQTAAALATSAAGDAATVTVDAATAAGSATPAAGAATSEAAAVPPTPPPAVPPAAEPPAAEPPAAPTPTT